MIIKTKYKIRIFFILFNTVVLKSYSVTLDKIIVRIDDEVIFQSDLNLAYLQYKMQVENSKNLSEIKNNILLNMINSKIFLKYARTIEPINEKLLDIIYRDRMKQMLAKFNNKKNELSKALKMNYRDVKELIRKNVKEQLIIKAVRDKISKNTHITIENIKSYLNSNIHKIPIMNKSYILKKYTFFPLISQSEKQKILKKANFIISKIKNGEKLENLVKEFSQDKNTVDKNGEIGYFWKKGDLIPEYENAVLKLKILPNRIKNQYKFTSDPIETNNGYYIIQLLKIKGCSYYTRHILIKSQNSLHSFIKLKNILKTEIEKIKQQKNNTFKIFNTKKLLNFTESKKEYVLNNNSGVRIEEKDLPLYLKGKINYKNQIIGPNELSSAKNYKYLEIIVVEDILPKRKANLKYDYSILYELVNAYQKKQDTKKWLNNIKKNITLTIAKPYSKTIFKQ